MICHGWYPTFNSEKLPASLSAQVVRQLLRTELNFRGLVMTDDLDMGAIYSEYGLAQTMQMAIGAGNDLAMICHRIDAIEQARKTIAALPAAALDGPLANVAQWKERLASPHPFSESDFQALDSKVWDLRVAVLGAERAAERSAEDGKRSPVETY